MEELTDIKRGITDDVLVIPTNDSKTIEELVDKLKQDKLSKEEKEILVSVLAGESNSLKDINVVTKKELDTLNLLLSREITITENSDNVAMFMSDLSLGVFQTVKLIHSGFSVTLRPITDDHFIGLDTKLAMETINLGRDTNGLIYSNLSVGLVKLIVDFIIPNIHKCTLKLSKKDNILDYIKIQDLNNLILGIIKSRYTNGVTITRGCINNTKLDNDKPVCKETVTGTLNTHRLLYTNHDIVTDEMLLFMGKEEVSIKEVSAYQNNLSVNKDKSYPFNLNDKEFNIVLKTPSVKEYLELGNYWVDKVIKKTEKLLSTRVTEETKTELINVQAKQHYLGTYLHLFKEIKSTNTTLTKVIDINRALNTLSSNPDAYKDILEMINNYKKSINITAIGIPTYKCGKCETVQSDDKIIPLDVVKTFFDLASLQTLKIMQRG